MKLKDIKEKQSSTPLYGNISRYQHIERLGSDEVDGILDGEVHIQEKIDGANLTVGYDNGLVIASRRRAIYKEGEIIDEFRGAVNYILNRPIYEKICKKYGWVLRGEWLVKHTITYPKEFTEKFWVFDVQKENKYIPYSEYAPILLDNNILFIKEEVIDNPCLNDLTPYLEKGDFGIEPEGIVIKNYNFINKYGRITWAKLVRSDFKELSNATFRATKYDSPEVAFCNLLTDSIIEKIIAAIIERDGKVSIKNMKEILGRSWHDLFTEELWNFVKKSKVKEFDFHKAHKLCVEKTKQSFLEYLQRS